MTLSNKALKRFLEFGHVTVPNIFSKSEMKAAIEDAMTWFEETLPQLDAAERALCLEPQRKVPRKLENPFVHRPFFTKLASHPKLVAVVAALIGTPLRVVYSQVFFKPPGGTAKPMHQDGYYFRPKDERKFVTAWVSLDGADKDNGSLLYADGSNSEPILPHAAPKNQPHHLKVDSKQVRRFPVMPEPVPIGGVSFHHPNTIHGSLGNRSKERWRRACVFHYSAEDMIVKPGSILE